MNVAVSLADHANCAVFDFVGFGGVCEKLTVGGVASIVQLWLCVVTFPAASLARTVNVCMPSESPLYDAGLVHAAAAPVSTWQVTVVAPLAVNEKLADELFDGSVGNAVIVSVGATVSTVHDADFVAVLP